MPVQIRPVGTTFESLAANDDAQTDNRLAFIDHAMFAEHRAIGRNLVIQLVWVYEHAIDFDELRRFHHSLGHG